MIIMKYRLDSDFNYIIDGGIMRHSEENLPHHSVCMQIRGLGPIWCVPLSHTQACVLHGLEKLKNFQRSEFINE